MFKKTAILKLSKEEKEFVRKLEDYAEKHNLNIESNNIYIHAKARKELLQEIVENYF